MGFSACGSWHNKQPCVLNHANHDERIAMSSPKKVYLIHGWAANRHVFDDLIPRLPAHWQCHALNLAGHGDAPLTGDFDVLASAHAFAQQIDEPAYVLGWSLGGLVALHLAALYPAKVKALCLTASFAKFQAAPDYPEGLSNPALAKMITLFQQDYAKYMRQFLQLQFLYAKEQHSILEKVLPDMVQHGAPAALQTALDAVAHVDARSLLPNIQAPTLLVFGQKDSITPPRMGEYLHRHLPHSELHLIEKAAHAPFLTQAAQFAALFHQFVEQH